MGLCKSGKSSCSRDACLSRLANPYLTYDIDMCLQVLAGSEPNEHGTWQYGRGGW